MNTLRISPSAYIDGLNLPELHIELVLAASRLVGTRVVASGLTDEFLVCRECACRGRDRSAILHAEDCITGWAARVLLAIAHAEANLISPTHRKEPSQQENSQSREPSRAAAREKRPFVLPSVRSQYHEPWSPSPDGELLDAEGHVMVDPQGCSLPEVGALLVMRRIVACVNHCAGVPTEALIAETARATAGGGR